MIRLVFFPSLILINRDALLIERHLGFGHAHDNEVKIVSGHYILHSDLFISDLELPLTSITLAS